MSFCLIFMVYYISGVPTPSLSGSGSFEVLTLGLTLGNGSLTDSGASQCIPIGPCRCRLTIGVFIPLDFNFLRM